MTKSRAEGYRSIAEMHHTELSRDMAAANERKLAEDLTFQPLPLPILGSRAPARINKRGTVPCPQPGCYSMFMNEKRLKIHLLKIHNEDYSEEAVYNCDFAGCNMVFETKQKARQHYYYVHELPTATCLLCDRVLGNEHRLKRHLREMHGQT
jgi:hypothetical protein